MDTVGMPPSLIGTGDSKLGVIVDRSSFEDDDEFSVLGAMPLVIDEEESMYDGVSLSGGARIMKNGKVKRRLRWKPSVFRRKKDFSSNHSVISALTTRSTSTNRSTSSAMSFLSHFSKKSNTSFHTFHSTATPVVKNSKQSQHTFQRPNYQDTFDSAVPSQTTISSEGQHVHKKMSRPKGKFRILETVHVSADRDAAPEDENAPLSPISESSIQFFDAFGESETPVDTSSRPPESIVTEVQLDQPGNIVGTSKRPPLFSRKPSKGRPPIGVPRSRSGLHPTGIHPGPMGSYSDTDSVLSNNVSPTSEAASVEREDSALPMLEGAEQEEDRRLILGSGSRGMKYLSGSGDAPDETDSVNGNHHKSFNQSMDAGSVAGTVSTSGTSATSGSTPRKRYNRPVDSTTKADNGNSSSEEPRRRASVPVDLDEDTFLEAEHNLRAIHDMAAEHLAHGEFEEAIEVFEEILRGQRERYGTNSYRVGTALHNLGLVHMKSGDYEKAIEITEKAVEVRKEALVPNHPDVAVSLAQLGVANLENEYFDESLSAFREALHIRRNLLGPKHPKCAKILNNIACALYSSGNYEEAETTFEEALDIQRDSLRKISDDNQDPSSVISDSNLLSIATTLCNLGSIKMKQGDLNEAELVLEEAMLIQQSVLPDEHPTIQTTLESIEYVERLKVNSIPTASELLSRWTTISSQGDQENPLMCAGHPQSSLICTANPTLEEAINLGDMAALSPETWFEQVGDAIADKTGCVDILSTSDFAGKEFRAAMQP